MDTHLYSIYCSTKIYDFSSQFPSEAAGPFWRQREKPICPGSPESPDVKSSFSVQRSSFFVSSRKLEILWSILLSRKTQDLRVFFCLMSISLLCLQRQRQKMSSNKAEQNKTKQNTTKQNKKNHKTQTKARQNKMPRQWSLWQKIPETYFANGCVTTVALRCSGSDPHSTHRDVGSRPKHPLAPTPVFLSPPLPLFPGKLIRR